MSFWIGLAIAVIAPIAFVEYCTPTNTILMTVPEKEPSAVEDWPTTTTGTIFGCSTGNTIIYGNYIHDTDTGISILPTCSAPESK